MKKTVLYTVLYIIVLIAGIVVVSLMLSLDSSTNMLKYQNDSLRAEIDTAKAKLPIQDIQEVYEILNGIDEPLRLKMQKGLDLRLSLINIRPNQYELFVKGTNQPLIIPITPIKQDTVK